LPKLKGADGAWPGLICCVPQPIHLLAGTINVKADNLVCFEFLEGLMAVVKITVKPNSSYRVEAPEGAVELVDINGNKYDLTGKTAFSLCRCGGSVNKPFCDGTHSKIGFQGADLAVKKADEAGTTPAPNLSGPKF
jgi:CDGSH-type Zn-finger protein